VLRILVVEDDNQLAETLKYLIEDNPRYRVVATAADADGAIAAAEQKDPDLVLLDLHLPNMSGALLYLALVRRWPRLSGRVILMTGDPTALEEGWPTELLACPLLLKPFTLSLLSETVRFALLDADGGDDKRASNGPA
jgi:DNA-binding response OmpR family regulator